MSARTNAREYADGFVYWQSEIRRTEEISESTSRLRDFMLLRSAVTELLREEVELLCDEQSPATAAALAQLLRNVIEADTEMYQDLTAQLAPIQVGDDGE